LFVANILNLSPVNAEMRENETEIESTLWHLMSDVPVMQCDAQNTEHQFQVTAFNDLPYADLF
jgi:hypothetical protein